MRKGIDTSINLTRFASCLFSKGFQFVARYYNINNQSKNLTLGEAHVLSNADLKIVAVWENGYPTHSGYFSRAKGVHDGTLAYHYASEEIRQPADTPIYFAVDYDASQTDIKEVITEYFKGLVDGFNTISQNNPSYHIGVYGSGMLCSSLLQSQLVSFIQRMGR